MMGDKMKTACEVYWELSLPLWGRLGSLVLMRWKKGLSGVRKICAGAFLHIKTEFSELSSVETYKVCSIWDSRREML